ncbi:aconitate hydratase AcnA [Noviherbaspirillum cavernae]|uniref:Aconitate hydratase n=1 Tax=Noviherbaspirillum cavernae TaxID=2320862 RepID=A0A418X2Z4_9BURK|nr:aconitate hydratase AcnA [Noviherbaspirillum cavernae]RJG06795.1 aconitate hydratase AcnA [Noviherbaspirillum cavernae]
MKTSPAYPPGDLDVAGRRYKIVDLPALFGSELDRLPLVLRILLENIVRNMRGQERDDAVAAIFGWLASGSSEAEIPFQPGRVLMHDTTSTPALVDIAAMRNVLAEHGVDPSLLNPVIPVDVSVDHSLAVEEFARPDAISLNLQHEMRRNEERYRFLRWASKTLSGVRIHPPGTGIMHTINLEQLATVVCAETRREESGEETWAVPDTLIGTDSHTPMINGIGVLGWGVGGLEAQTVMFGMPTMLRIPDVVGVRLTGALGAACTSTDLALTVTQRLRQAGVTGDFVEFFGPSVDTLSAGDRAVVANMAPEYGATTGYFGIDRHTISYLRATGRTEDAQALVEAYARRTGLWFEPGAEPRYSRVIEIDLDDIGMHVAGPTRPQDRLRLADVPAALQQFSVSAPSPELPLHPIAIASITSCTNTSDPALLIAAGLVARKARAFGLQPARWVKTSLAPGSPASASYLKRTGLLPDLEAIGFGIVGFGCATCIGNSGPLTEPIRKMIDEGSGKPVAALSGNRNFPGRVHPDLDLGFIMSPALVIAYGLAGDADKNLEAGPIQTTADGKPVYLRDLWPTREEIARCLAAAQDTADYRRDFERAEKNPAWHGLDAPDSALFPWDERSNYLQRPPFASLEAGGLLGNYRAYPLMVLGDDITTDHISPASAIPPKSLVADYLVQRGDKRNDLNVFASRRGNWQVMLRGTFHNRNVINLLKDGLPVAHTVHVPSGDVMPIWEAAQRYRDDGESIVVIAGERYGTGSSRDWAAKGLRLLNVRSVLACSFERIHRSNLIGMGILPVQLPAAAIKGMPAIALGDRIEIHADADALSPRCPIAVRVHRANGTVDTIAAKAAVETQLEINLLKAGGVIPLILDQTIQSSRQVAAS